MSWMKCDGYKQPCGALVNTDDEPESFVEVGNMRRHNKTICLCRECRDAREDFEEQRWQEAL